jgi:hypothetical protein
VPPAFQEGMDMSRGIGEAAYNLALIIDAERLCGRSPRKIQLSKLAEFTKQSVLGPGRVGKDAHQVPEIVDAHGFGSGGAGKVKLGKDAVLVNHAMLLARLVHKVARNFSPVVDTVQLGAGAAGYIDLRECDAPSLGLRRNVCQQQDREGDDGQYASEQSDYLTHGISFLR